MAKAGHGHLLIELEDYTTDEGSEVDDIDTPPMSPSRRVIIKAAQKMQPEPQGPMAEELLNPYEGKECPTMALYHGIARQAISYPSGLYAASVWLADGCQSQHEGAIQANVFPCTCGPEQTCQDPYEGT